VSDAPLNGGQPRDVMFERRWTALAAASARIDDDRLSSFAEQRAGDAPVRDLETRNFAREVLEELADARNYLVWWSQQVTALDDSSELTGEIIEQLGQSLASVATAFGAAERARALSVEWRAGRA
jgi:alkylation response protein AidB-like acyl-CoA dehydrogenase